MKQLLLPADVSEVTMQKEILTPPICIKTKQNAHPRTLGAFAVETLSAVIQYYRTIGNIWDSPYAKHQLRDSDITLDRVYSILSEFLIELKLNEEQEKIAQIATGSNWRQPCNMTIGDKMAVNMDIIALSIIPGDNQADAR